MRTAPYGQMPHGKARRGSIVRAGIFATLALLALATAPHLHDEAEERHLCVPCHVQGPPLIASSVHEEPDLTAAGSVDAHALWHACDAEVEGPGSRAPPA